MTTLFPGALDSFTNPDGDTSQASSRTHSQQHGDLNDAVEAMQRKFREGKVDVKDYGALGDGAADDTAAIANADAAAEASGKALHFPPGQYLSDAIYNRSPWVGAGRDLTIIKRRVGAATGSFLSAGKSTFALSDMTIDGNAANPNGCNSVYVPSGTASLQLSRVIITGAKANAGWGTGLVVDGLTEPGASFIDNCVVHSNGASGAAIDNAINLSITNSSFRNNVTDGLALNNYDPTFAQKLISCRVVGNEFYGNGQSGCVVGNYVENNSPGAPVYGQLNPEASQIVVSGNNAGSNGWYGIAISGYAIAATGNTSRNNALAAATTGGFLFTAKNSVLAGNVTESNLGCGIDAGGAMHSIVSGNMVNDNGTVGINCEGNVRLDVSGNSLNQNGAAGGGVQILVERSGAASALRAFPSPTSFVAVKDNTIHISGTRVGVNLTNNPAGC
jgi:hypothetical protein